MKNTGDSLLWGNLLHLSYNMWCDRETPEFPEDPERRAAKPYLRFDEALWHNLLERMSAAGMNMVVIDLGDAVQYASHPEIAVENAWSRGKLKDDLARARDLGLEPLPKLNFSTCHDAWLGHYSRCVSTEAYYTTVRDLIAESIELFDGPRFFHLGMDEEIYDHQAHYAYVVIRQFELWWHDFHIMREAVEKNGARPWIWSDYLWHHPDEFLANMPRSVLQSNWYYDEDFPAENTAVKAYKDLEENGYDQIPTGSNHATPVNFERTVEHCSDVISGDRLYGFLTAPWRPTLAEFRERHMAAIEQVARAIEAHSE
jgi:hypothetical protein